MGIGVKNKKKIFLIFVLSILLLFVSIRNVNAQEDSSLKAWLKFDGSAIDSSGYNNNGFAFNTTLVQDRFGNSNSSFYFDGRTSYVDIGTSTFDINTSNEFTISAWIKPTGANYVYTTMIKRGRYNYPFSFDYANTKRLRVTLRTSSGTYSLNGNAKLNFNNWYHVVYVYNKTSGRLIYVNGSLDKQDSTKGTLNVQNGESTVIGKTPYVNDYYFKGAIDDLRIYNKALSYSEIRALYTSLPQCRDGLDNDANGCFDYPTDFGCTNSNDTMESGGTCLDTTPSVRSNGLPTGTLPTGTTQITISLDTNENAVCRYSTTSGVAYASMTNTFTTTGGASHSQLITDLADGQAYNYYVRCNDTSGNVNTNDFSINFSVGSSCVPLTCSSLGYECGSGYANGTCSGALNCGSCGSQSTCFIGTCVCDSGWSDCSGGVDNDCECDLTSNYCFLGSCVPSCTPTTCSSLGYECGNWSDTCSGTLNCGSCGDNQSCVGGTCLDTTPPVRSNGTPSGALPAGTTQTNMSLITDEAATCKYSTSVGTDYSLMTNTFSTTGETSHSQLITGLVNGQAYNYYVRCNDAAGNVNTNDFPISFSVDSPPSPPSGNVYYVKTSSCNDSNSGNSDASAWCHCPGMGGWTGTATLQPGDTVYFRSQDTFSWGSGDYLLQTKTNGTTYDGSTYGNGTRAKFQATGNIIQAKVIILHSNITFKNIEIDGQGYSGGGIYINYMNPISDISNIIIDNCVVHNIGTGDVMGAMGIGVSPINGRKITNIAITNTKVYNISHEGIALYPGWQTIGNKIINATIRGCEIYNIGVNASNYADGIIVKDNVTNAVIEFNYIHDNQLAGVQFETYSKQVGIPTDITVRHNIIKNNRWGLWVLNSAGGAISADIYSNLFISNGAYNVTDGGALFWANFPYSTSLFNLYSNTFYCTNSLATNKYCVIVGGSSTGTPTINFKNNIIYADNNIPIQDRKNWFTHSNNLIYRTSNASDTHVYNGTNYNRAGVTTWEPSAQNTDPIFKNPSNLPTNFTGIYGINMIPNTDGLSIIPPGAAINNGTSLTAFYNGAINFAGTSSGLTRPQGAAWDIGVYEYP